MTSTKAYLLTYLCMLIVTLWSPNQYVHPAPQYNEGIDDRLIFNSTISNLAAELDSTLSRIKAKKDTIELQTKELQKIAHKVKPNEPEISDMGLGRDGIDPYISTESKGVQIQHSYR